MVAICVLRQYREPRPSIYYLKLARVFTGDVCVISIIRLFHQEVSSRRILYTLLYGSQDMPDSHHHKAAIEKAIIKKTLNPFSWFRVFLFCIILLSPLFSAAQEPLNWRFFTSEDGLKESWVSTISRGPSGKLWINHGDVDKMSIYDGYSFFTLLSPGSHVPVFENAANQLWSIYPGSPGGFLLFDNGRWNKYEIAAMQWHTRAIFPFPRIFLPVQLNQSLFLAPEQLVQFDCRTRQIQTRKKADATQLGRFTEITSALDGGVWIGGEHGAAKFHEAAAIQSSTMEWNEFLFPGHLNAQNLKNIVEGNNGEIFGVALSKTNTKKRVLLHFDGHKWDIMPEYGDKQVYGGWRGNDNTYWLIKKDTEQSLSSDLWHVQQNQAELEKKNKIISGRIHAMLAEPGGVFWLASPYGLARYAPPLWRTPSEAVMEDDTSFIIPLLEFPKDHIWYTGKNTLCLLYNGEKKEFPFPDNHETSNYTTHEICSLPNNKLLIKTDSNVEFLLFDIIKKNFIPVRHPDHLFIQDLFQRDVNTVWVVNARTDGTCLLDIFDGYSFIPYIDRIAMSSIGGDISTIQESQNGDLWLGGAIGLVRYRGGVLTTIGSTEGYSGQGALHSLALANGRMWFSARDKIFEYDGDLWSLVPAPGLETVRSMIQSCDGSIWIGSGSGVHRFYQGSWVSYSYEEGLPDSTIINLLEDSRGRIWASAMNGITLYHPDADTDSPQTFITSGKNLREISQK